MGRALTLLLVVATAVATGCTSTSSPPPAPVPPPALHSDADQRVAEQALPTLADLGDGYATSPFTPSADSRVEDATLSSCLGRPPTVEHETARTFSPQFTAGDDRIVLAGITFVDTLETARADLAALDDEPRAAPCLRDSLARQLDAAGGRADDVTVTRIRPAPGGDDVVAYRLVVQSGPLPVVVDLISALVGRAEVSISFQDPAHPVPADLQDRVVRACLDRLAAAG